MRFNLTKHLVRLGAMNSENLFGPECCSVMMVDMVMLSQVL